MVQWSETKDGFPPSHRALSEFSPLNSALSGLDLPTISHRFAAGSYFISAYGYDQWGNQIGYSGRQLTVNPATISGTTTAATPASTTVSPAKDPDTPVARITANPNPATVDEPVIFSASNSTAATGSSIVRYEWDLEGDGTYTTGTLGTPPGTQNYTTYITPGTVNVGLRVTDSNNRTGTTTLALPVQASGGSSASMAKRSSSGFPFSLKFSGQVLSDAKRSANGFTVTDSGLRISGTGKGGLGAKARKSIGRKSKLVQRLLLGKWRTSFDSSIDMQTGRGKIVGSALTTTRSGSRARACLLLAIPLRSYKPRQGSFSLISADGAASSLRLSGSAEMPVLGKTVPPLKGLLKIGHGKSRRLNSSCGTPKLKPN